VFSEIYPPNGATATCANSTTPVGPSPASNCKFVIGPMVNFTNQFQEVPVGGENTTAPFCALTTVQTATGNNPPGFSTSVCVVKNTPQNGVNHWTMQMQAPNVGWGECAVTCIQQANCQ
jgi:hypothetical protein